MTSFFSSSNWIEQAGLVFNVSIERRPWGIHFVQEDSPDQIGRPIADWMGRWADAAEGLRFEASKPTTRIISKVISRLHILGKKRSVPPFGCEG
jgi:hypothetical protein